MTSWEDEELEINEEKAKYSKLINNLLSIGRADKAIFTEVKNVSYFDVTTKFDKKHTNAILDQNDFTIRMQELDLEKMISELGSLEEPQEIIDLYDKYKEKLSLANRKLILKLEEKEDIDWKIESLVANLKLKLQKRNNRWKDFRRKVLDINIQENVWSLHVATCFVSAIVGRKTIYGPLLLKEVTLTVTNSAIKLESLSEWKINEKIIFLLNSNKFDFPENIDFKEMSTAECIDKIHKVFRLDFSLESIKGEFKNIKKLDIFNMELLPHKGVVLGIFKPGGGALRKKMLEIIRNREVDDILKIEPDKTVYKERLYGAITTPSRRLFKTQPSNFSQEKALISSLIQDTIIWGPPGTGKSQVISNIITNILYNDKSAVVLAQKKAALDVLKDRLGKLSYFTLFILNDNKMRKSEFYQPLQEFIKMVENRKLVPVSPPIEPMITPEELEIIEAIKFSKEQKQYHSSLKLIKIFKEDEKALKTFYNINSKWEYPDSGLEMKEYFDSSMKINNIDPNKSSFQRWGSKNTENEIDIRPTLQFELETKFRMRSRGIKSLKETKKEENIEFMGLNFPVIDKNQKTSFSMNYEKPLFKNTIPFQWYSKEQEEKVAKYQDTQDELESKFKINLNDIKSLKDTTRSDIIKTMRSNCKLFQEKEKFSSDEDFLIRLLSAKIIKKIKYWEDNPDEEYSEKELKSELYKRYNPKPKKKSKSVQQAKKQDNNTIFKKYYKNNPTDEFNNIQSKTKFQNKDDSKFEYYGHGWHATKKKTSREQFKSLNMDRGGFYPEYDWDDKDGYVVDTNRDNKNHVSGEHTWKTKENPKEKEESAEKLDILKKHIFEKENKSKYNSSKQVEKSRDYISEMAKFKEKKVLTTPIKPEDRKKNLYKKYKSFANSIRAERAKPFKFIDKHYEIIKQLFKVIVTTPQTTFVNWSKNSLDFAILDESSQMFLETGLPIIHSAKTKILAGDLQQMQPSSWFGTRDTSLNEEVDDVAENAESILSYAFDKGVYQIMLNKNYRSSSASLMSFSSKQFYKSELEVIDNLNKKHDKPIEVINVDGVWNHGINEKEAEKLIEVTLELQDDFKKIILLTFNSKQQQLIQNIIIEKHPELYEKMEEQNLVLRNIENIQGDEADLVIASVCYDEHTHISSTYVCRNGGKNALNVAISRAKEKFIVIKSVTAKTIKNARSENYLIFKEWLIFLDKTAEDQRSYSHGENELIESHGDIDSGFERDVIDYMKMHIKTDGQFDLEKQFEVGSKKIDIAIINRATEEFILGIEVDGFKYHGGMGFDKVLEDKARQEFLENKGYPIYRITEIDWQFKRDKLINDIKALIE